MSIETEDIALTFGEWRPAPNGILRWVPEPKPVRVKDDPAAIACPKCRARADQTCRTKKGHKTTDHAARIIPRCCPCGTPVGYKKQRCDACLVHVQRIGLGTRRRLKAEAEWAA